MSFAERQVNGEAVEVEVRVARLGSRALALLLDIGVQALLIATLTVLTLVVVVSMPGDLVDDAFIQTAIVALTIAVFIVYPTAMETLTNGRSIG